MAGKSMFSEAELAFLRELNRAQVEFLVVGLSAAALQGAPVVTQDVDLWFRDLSDPGIRKALRKVGGAYVAPTGSQPPMFAGRAVNLFEIAAAVRASERFIQLHDRHFR